MAPSKIKLYAIFAITACSAVALATATYAWLEISRLPKVSDISLSLITENGVQIAPDEEGAPGEWAGFLDMSDILEDEEPLTPVTYSYGDQALYEPVYGEDGRPGGVIPTSEGDFGSYIEVSYWMKSGSSASAIQLAEPDAAGNALDGGGTYVMGEPIWNSSTISHDNGGNGGETTIRVGFLVQKTDLQYNPVGESEFFIYEPNCDTHTNGTEGYEVTASAFGLDTLVEDSHLIIQESSYWSEQSPVLRDNVDYHLGQFTQNTELFTIDAQELVKITMYIWMEGQDLDCTNMTIAKSSQLIANIQFTSDEESASDTGIVAR